MFARQGWAVFMFALLMVAGSCGSAFAQGGRTRDDQPSQERGRTRGEPDGPKAELRQKTRDREPDEGLEEGMPSVGATIDKGRIRVQPSAGWKLGVYARNLDTGVRITRVLRGSAASRAGLETGDTIVTINGYQIGYVLGRLYSLGDELQRQAGSAGQVTLLVQNVRNQRLVNLDVRLDRAGR